MLRGTVSFSSRLLLLVVLATAACGSDGAVNEDAGGGADAGTYFPPARTDLVGRVGGDQTLDIATWNLENFPRFSTTAESVADLIASLDLDLIVVQEIHNVDAFAEVVARLPGYDGVLSAHIYGDGTFQKLGFIYRTSVVELGEPALLFQNNGYEFPRPPLKVRVRVLGTDLDFDAIAVHLKAGLADEDQDRRQRALELLEGNVRASIDGSGDDDVLVLGDFNDTITKGQAVFGVWLEATDRYTFQTAGLAGADAYSFVPAESLIDHLISSISLADELADAETLIPNLLQELPGYATTVSDHLPVIMKMPLP